MQTGKNQLPEGLVYPTESFEDFYFKFKSTKEMLQDPEWFKVYSSYYELSPYEMQVPVGESVEDLNSFSADKQIEEVIKCAKDFFYFCHRYVKILHPKFGTIPFVLYKYQRRVIKEYDTNRFNMISKFRQGGLSTVTVLWGLWKCMFQKDQQIYFLSKTDREALAAGDIARRAMDNFPYWMYDKNNADITKHEKNFNDVGSKICFYTPEAARGKSATYIMIDEAAFIDKMDEHWKAMYPVIATGGHIEIISTVNGLGNWYEETYHEAQAGRNFFNIIDLDYWEHPVYANPEWAAAMRANLGEKGWQQEVLRDFLGSGDTYISSNVISQYDRGARSTVPARTAFAKWTNESQQKQQWEEGALWIWKEPMAGHEYIVGVDCAEGVGRDGDNSCFEIIDAVSLEQVAEFYSNLVPPNIFAQIINQIGIYYNTATVVVENNSVGGAVLNSLSNDMGYEAVYYESKKSSTKLGIKMGPSNRPIFLEAMQNRLMNGTVRINSHRLVNELKTFIYSPQKKRAEAIKGKHDDAIMALCLALYVRDERIRGLPLNIEYAEQSILAKNAPMDDIKKEILDGGVSDWFEIRSGDGFSTEERQDSRKNSPILKEFGW
jgi:phage FluMu gp28-like protein